MWMAKSIFAESSIEDISYGLKYVSVQWLKNSLSLPTVFFRPVKELAADSPGVVRVSERDEFCWYLRNEKSALLVCFKYSSSTRYSRSHVINVFLLKYLPNLISRLWCIFLKIPKLFFGSSHQDVLCRKFWNIEKKFLWWQRILWESQGLCCRGFLINLVKFFSKAFRRQDIAFLKNCSMLNS